ncbi:hypothetical protein F511_12230 [Dorcoceras hygrometricum]|uniref:Uncharacterized protein n=1 Tax=Dorcoceras hygrometricum TaxID=472368 RepID=A0A2Z7AWG5_9LAMI|nr:hypothetical protein F511_12230 [Dorcoceras hygrometricum]
MRRFFFVKRVGKKRDPWKCEMSWRDNIYILTPRTPERSPNLASFLNAMCDKSYNAPELIQEDILCFFGFSRRGIELVGDLGIVVSRLSCVMICSRAYALSGLTFTLFFFVHERMDKAEMLRAMEGAEAASSGASALPTKATKKRKASTPADKEARRQRKKKRASTSEMRPAPTTEKSRAPMPPIPANEERPVPTPVITIPEASSPKEGPTKEAGPGRVPPLNFFEDSLVVSPSGVVATNLLCHIAPDRDIGRLAGANNAESVGLLSSNLAAALAWGGEVIKRLIRAQREAAGALKTQPSTAPSSKCGCRGGEGCRDAFGGIGDSGAELAEIKARPEEEAERLRSEAINAWDLGKEAFLKSSEFGSLCAKKALGYFKVGFSSCLAQFRANGGYFEEEHPTSFLDVKKALMDMADEEEAED